MVLLCLGLASAVGWGQPGWPTDPKVPQAVRTIAAVANMGPFKPTWASLERYQVPAWYQDAKFGIFIHWGAYSVPAFGNEWYPRNMYLTNSPEYQHHLATYGSPARFGYKDFLPLFKAEKFDARQWARLFKEAGARYVVPVAEHHDGFPMYDCSYTRYSAARLGPQRDVLGELAKALRQEGLILGASSHRIEHWWFMNGGAQFDSDVADARYAAFYGPAMPEKAPLTREFMDDWLARSCEIVDRYRPQLVWFDWWIEQPAMEPYRRQFAAYYYNRAAQWGQGVAINYKNKAFPENAAVYDIERGQLAGLNPRFWQTDTSVSKNSWGYVARQDYKSATSIVQDLVDIVSKNGCLLLNIGPKPDGTIPEPEANLLRNVGRWLKVNGEAVYGTRPWLSYGEGPTRVLSGGFTDTKRQAFTAADLRFTTHKDILYALALAWPADGRLLVRSLARRPAESANQISKVRLLGHSGPLTWSQTDKGLVVTLPPDRPCDHVFALRIQGRNLKPAPLPVNRLIEPAADGSFVLTPELAELHGVRLVAESQGGLPALSHWTDPTEFATWRIRCSQPGHFQVLATYAAADGETQFVVDAGGDTLVAKASRTANGDDFQTTEAGWLQLRQGGEHTVMMGPLNAVVWKPLSLRQLTLRPVSNDQ